jgi:hypothetical protein
LLDGVGAIAGGGDGVGVIRDGGAQPVAGEVGEPVQRVVLIFRMDVVGIGATLEVPDVIVVVGGDAEVHVIHRGEAVQFIVGVAHVRAVRTTLERDVTVLLSH